MFLSRKWVKVSTLSVIYKQCTVIKSFEVHTSATATALPTRRRYELYSSTLRNSYYLKRKYCGEIASERIRAPAFALCGGAPLVLSYWSHRRFSKHLGAPDLPSTVCELNWSRALRRFRLSCSTRLLLSTVVAATSTSPVQNCRDSLWRGSTCLFYQSHHRRSIRFFLDSIRLLLVSYA